MAIETAIQGLLQGTERAQEKMFEQLPEVGKMQRGAFEMKQISDAVQAKQKETEQM